MILQFIFMTIENYTIVSWTCNILKDFYNPVVFFNIRSRFYNNIVVVYFEGKQVYIFRQIEATLYLC